MNEHKIKLCPKMCNECPFYNKSIKGFIADYNVMDFHQIMSNEISFPCHKSMSEDDIEFKEAEYLIDNGEITMCREYVESVIKSAKSPYHNKQLIEAIKQVKIDGLSEHSMSIFEFINHHTKI